MADNQGHLYAAVDAVSVQTQPASPTPTPTPSSYYVADPASPGGAAGEILRVDPTTGAQTVVSSGGQFVDPYSVAVAPDGSLVVADPGTYGGTGTIFRVDPTTGAQSVITTGGYLVDPGVVTFAPDGQSAGRRLRRRQRSPDHPGRSHHRPADARLGGRLPDGPVRDRDGARRDDLRRRLRPAHHRGLFRPGLPGRSHHGPADDRLRGRPARHPRGHPGRARRQPDRLRRPRDRPARRDLPGRPADRGANRDLPRTAPSSSPSAWRSPRTAACWWPTPMRPAARAR